MNHHPHAKHRKTLAFLTALVMMLSLLPAPTATAEEPCAHNNTTCVSVDADQHMVQCADCDMVLEYRNHWDFVTSIPEDENQHKYECAACGEELGYGEHWNLCPYPDVCTECGAAYTSGEPGHWYDMGSWQHDEQNHWLVCEGCGEYTENFGEHWNLCPYPDVCCECGIAYTSGDPGHWFNSKSLQYDAENHWLVCEGCGEKQNTEAHWRCCFTDKCEYCEVDYTGDNVWHDIDEDVWEYDEAQHWVSCANCDEKINAAPHTADPDDPSVCKDCGAKLAVEPTDKTPTDSDDETSTEPDGEKPTDSDDEQTTEPDEKPTEKPTTKPADETSGETEDEPVEDTTEDEEHTYGECVYAGNGMHEAFCLDCGFMTSAPCVIAMTEDGLKTITACTVCEHVFAIEETAANIADILTVLQPAAVEEEAAEAPAAVTETMQTMLLEVIPDAELAQGNVTVTTAEVENATITIAGIPNAKVQVTAQTIALSEVQVAMRVIRIALDNMPEETMLTEPATLRIPCAEEETEVLSAMKLVLICEDGTLQEIAFEIIDGEIVFETELLGTFAFVPADMLIE